VWNIQVDEPYVGNLMIYLTTLLNLFVLTSSVL